MSSEVEWVKSLVEWLESGLQAAALAGCKVRVKAGKRLPYSHEVHRYKPDGPDPAKSQVADYQTDLLVFDEFDDRKWTPRVVIECKLGSITTHDVLTYSTKAATHKQVHPYLRYGILIGNREDYAVPGRLFRHGAYFDFMATWRGEQPTDQERDDILEVLKAETRFSRQIQELLTTSRSRSRTKFTLVHRPLILKEFDVDRQP